MWINLMLAIIGFTGGVAVAGGTFALLVKLGIFTRLVEIARTAKNIKALETFVIIGGVFGNIFSLFPVSIPIGTIGIIICGMFWGMYVGWLHMALAEVLSMFSVAFRRLKLKYGLGLSILFIGIGKMTGALIYFYNNWGVNM